MALKNLSSEIMVTITGRLLDPERDRPVVEALPLVSPLIPAMVMVHEGLISRQHLIAAIERELAKLLADMATLDKLHDRKKRAVYSLLTALAELTDDESRGPAYLDLRDRLMPRGLMEVRRSYLDQVGDAQLMPSRLDDASRALLQSITTPEGPLEGDVDQWVEAAVEIGRLDERRAQLAAERSTGQGASPGEAYAMKLSWIRVIRSMINMLDTDPQATPEIKERLLAPLRRAEAQADRRRRGEVGAEDPAEVPVEDPVDDPGEVPIDEPIVLPELPAPAVNLASAPAPTEITD
jgi:hypothetical protein